MDLVYIVLLSLQLVIVMRDEITLENSINSSLKNL